MFKKFIVVAITAFLVSTSFTPFIVDDVYAKGFLLVVHPKNFFLLGNHRNLQTKQIKRHPVLNQANKPPQINLRAIKSTYFTRRNQYYGDYNPPVYVYDASPSYGLWDTIFLYSLLSSMNNNSNAAQFAYHHQNDPDYVAWRKDAEKLALENAELKAQLAKLDEQTRKMSGTPDPNFIPSGIDADIAMSQEVLNTLKPTMRVCVASVNGTYFRVLAGVIIPGTNTVNIIPVTTSGSGEILSNIEKGKCDAGFVQGDSYWNYVEEHNTVNLPFERVSSLYKEATHLICHEDGPESIGELTSSNTIWFPSMSGSGRSSIKSFTRF